MDDYLSKPVKIEALRSILTAWTPPTTDDAEWPDELSTGVADTVIDRGVLASYKDLQQPGEPDIVVKLIDLFMDRSSESITCLQRAALAGDLSEVIRQAHGIKGSSGNIGAGVMAGLSARLEKVDSPLAAVELAATLEKAFEDVSGILVSIRDECQDGGM
jgi:HPt (histidine-containing phosphotransfer) domain-containing protein